MLKKKRILQIAEDAGLVFNNKAPYHFSIQPWHAEALYEFYKLIEKELKNEKSNKDEGKIQYPSASNEDNT